MKTKNEDSLLLNDWSIQLITAIPSIISQYAAYWLSVKVWVHPDNEYIIFVNL